MNEYIETIRKSYENLQKVTGAENHDPFRGHRSTDDESKSRFSCSNPDLHLLSDILGTGKIVDEVPGRNGAVCLIVDASFVVGETVFDLPIENNEYVMKTVHGELQPCGVGQLSRHNTTISTWIRTPEKAKDGSMLYVLASVHPGLPDNAGNREGLTEGQIITGRELLERGIIRVCNG